MSENLGLKIPGRPEVRDITVSLGEDDLILVSQDGAWNEDGDHTIELDGPRAQALADFLLLVIREAT